MLHKPLFFNIKTYINIVKSLTCLHNFLITTEMSEPEGNRQYVNEKLLERIRRNHHFQLDEDKEFDENDDFEFDDDRDDEETISLDEHNVSCQLSLIFSQKKIKISGKRKSDENLEDLTSGDGSETEDLNQSQYDTLASS